MKTAEDICLALKQSDFHLEALRAVRSLDLPQACIGAGFVRNYIWDILHGQPMSPLNDIDVIYHDKNNIDPHKDREYEQKLAALMPDQPWSVKNQARMHIKNGDDPYKDIGEALSYWIETPTAIAAHIDSEDEIILTIPLGIEDIINCEARPTPLTKASPHKLIHYKKRMTKKNWPAIWSKIKIYGLE